MKLSPTTKAKNQRRQMFHQQRKKCRKCKECSCKDFKKELQIAISIYQE
jgi:hypothetical protein